MATESGAMATGALAPKTHATETAPRFLARFFAELRRAPKGMIGFAIIAIVLVTATFAPLLVPHDPTMQVLGDRFRPPFYAPDGSLLHFLGADNMGRDILSRVILGTRTSVFVALIVIVIIAVFGSTVGLLSGYFGGVLDAILMRIVDFQLSFPFLLLALILLAIFGPGFETLIFALSVAFWVNFARLVRSETLKLRETDFVQAARSIGVSDAAIMVKHILPNAFPSIIVLATLDVAIVIISEAALSFLGLGIQPPTPSWGMMISDGRNYLYQSPWIVLAPGTAIVATAIGINLFGDFLRDTYDPRQYRL